jgi:sialate O-acetylesterase
MVLQQAETVQLWGKAKPNSKIKIQASWNQRAYICYSDQHGDWKHEIKTPKASYHVESLSFDDGVKTRINHVLIGEVWFCSGQSNMEMPLKGFNNQPIDGAEKAINEASAKHGISIFKVKRNTQDEPVSDAAGNWQLSTPQNAAELSALAYFFALHLQDELNVPIGIINSSWGGSAIECWVTPEINLRYTDYQPDTSKQEREIWNRPSVLYNGMIKPFVNYTVKGFVWYQGETNVGRYATYAGKLTALIELWRNEWKNLELPFYTIEITPYLYKEIVEPAKLREAQFQVAISLKNCDILCTNDLVKPEEFEIPHPAQKEALGERLAKAVLFDNYLKELVPSGRYSVDTLCSKSPRFETISYSDSNTLEVHLANCGKGILHQDEYFGFEIAGSDSLFYPAKATLQPDKQTFLIESEFVNQVVAVRYCFKNFQPGNVKNSCGLPLFPFRTDGW